LGTQLEPAFLAGPTSGFLRVNSPRELCHNPELTRELLVTPAFAGVAPADLIPLVYRN